MPSRAKFGLAMPDDPTDPANRTNLGQSTWSVVVRAIKLMDSLNSGALWGIAGSRFKKLYDIAKTMMRYGEITPIVRRYLHGDPPPWLEANLTGLLWCRSKIGRDGSRERRRVLDSKG
ncbi:hypothetical protein [Rhodococcus sp. KBW08]|uniref:hypothetical protein n=1 Tax=Rhodococcus sp. KBW08 TaxID=2144188 RepID=UPI00162682D3|nr:hypothetical protein [Rhodococcus sp. KBW08]